MTADDAATLPAWVSAMASTPRAAEKVEKPPKVAERLLVPRWRWPAAHAHLVKHGGWFECVAASNYGGAVIVRADRPLAGILLQHHHAEAAPEDADTSPPPLPKPVAAPANAEVHKSIARLLAFETHGIHLPEGDA